MKFKHPSEDRRVSLALLQRSSIPVYLHSFRIYDLAAEVAQRDRLHTEKNDVDFTAQQRNCAANTKMEHTPPPSSLPSNDDKTWFLITKDVEDDLGLWFGSMCRVLKRLTGSDSIAGDIIQVRQIACNASQNMMSCHAANYVLLTAQSPSYRMFRSKHGIDISDSGRNPSSQGMLQASVPFLPQPSSSHTSTTTEDRSDEKELLSLFLQSPLCTLLGEINNQNSGRFCEAADHSVILPAVLKLINDSYWYGRASEKKRKLHAGSDDIGSSRSGGVSIVHKQQLDYNAAVIHAPRVRSVLHEKRRVMALQSDTLKCV